VVTSYNPQCRRQYHGGERSQLRRPTSNSSTTPTQTCCKAAGQYRSLRGATPRSLFIKEPPNMKLLIVVDKLLTGLRCAALHLSLHRQVACRTTASSKPSAAPTGSMARTRTSATSWTTSDLFTKGGERYRRLHLRARPHGRRVPDPKFCSKTASSKARRRLDDAVEALSLHLRAGEAAEGRPGAHPLFLRQHRDRLQTFKHEGTAARHALQSRRGLDSRLRGDRG
jgi:hypothetical protein